MSNFDHSLQAALFLQDVLFIPGGSQGDQFASAAEILQPVQAGESLAVAHDRDIVCLLPHPISRLRALTHHGCAGEATAGRGSDLLETHEAHVGRRCGYACIWWERRGLRHDFHLRAWVLHRYREARIHACVN
ncbi:hypothetical protein D7W82_03190 [Corallococcus sp. CA049B]|nr:hypothetical protein D7W82_03190 [Corallococcus sp. CA049B]